MKKAIRMAITQRTYAHLAPEAWTADYGRVRFVIPTAADNVRQLKVM
jgi:hypothetical protein